MSEDRLKLAMLGLGDGGQLLLKAADQAGHFAIEAVADRDAVLAEKTASEYSCAAFDDYRQLIIQNQLDCLLVAASLHSCDEYVRMAMSKKFNVLKLAPPARHFEEAVEFVRLAEHEKIQFAIANPRRFRQSFAALRRQLEQGKIEQVFLITSFCNFGEQQQAGWQTDPKLAGGGVLLHNCYEMIDQIVCNFGIAEQVYSLIGSQAQDRQQRHYLTEDTAMVTIKFSDTLMGNLIASRRGGIGPVEEWLKIYGKDRVLTVSDTRLNIGEDGGRGSKETAYDDDELVCMKEVLKNFALSILSPDEHKLCSSGRENLKVMAVIESAYLSARTGMAEEPSRVLQMAQIEPTTM